MNAFATFYNTEFCIDEVSWYLAAAYFGFALIIVELVRICGPVSLSNYILETSYYSDDESKENVIYRMFSPVIWANLFVLAICMFLAPLNKIDSLQMRWLPVLFYWIILCYKKNKLNNWGISYGAFALEASISVTASILFDWCVVFKFPQLGVAALDQSAIGFQMMAMVCYATVQYVISSVRRKKYRTYLFSQNAHSFSSSTFSYRKTGCHQYKLRDTGHYYSPVDTSERKLFEYERRFGKLLPKRYSDDILLRSIFFSIMAIEDANRPKSVRLLERVLCRLGHAKTTGIMQQKSTEPLSDEKSVLLAAEYVIQMWDRFLSEYARFSGGNGSPDIFVFGRNWYRYCYEELARVLSSNFSSLYGDYSGSRVMPANRIFTQVRSFMERNRYSLLPKSVTSYATLFATETNWLKSEPLYWKDESTVSIVQNAFSSNLPHYSIRHDEKISKSTVTATLDRLSKLNIHVESVFLVEPSLCSIEFCSNKSIQELIHAIGDEWTIQVL